MANEQAVFTASRSHVTVGNALGAPAWECIRQEVSLLRYGFPRRSVGTSIRKLPALNELKQSLLQKAFAGELTAADETASAQAVA